MIIDNLAGCGVYSDLIAAFTTEKKPDLNWNNASLPWAPKGNSGTIELGLTTTDKAQGTVNRSATVSLNTNILRNSSQLMIAAIAIHETLHAYINYKIITGGPTFTAPPYYDSNKPWLYSVDAYAWMLGLPSNFRDHWSMLDEYFDKAVKSLKTFDNGAHTDQEYAMTILYGLNNGSDYLPMQGLINR
ncbi:MULTISPECIES: hypothetical protein [Mucilaginibacter]|uniref:hypothetical protein n=1 Tax=Mucilaginibacter TaxID=423349 RepID=UPI00159E6D68|nr:MULTISPECIES: hypothetical protein [Mucilaginibacter]NVM63757.1 hypothetical protein [Mucilaginibacter sp. SG538B]